MDLPTFLDCRSDSQAVDTLRKLEWKEIRQRRFAAGIGPEPSPAEAALPHEQVRLPDDLVGLALSGGGVRSAAYNLGFLQALSETQLLRYVDYMSSVSGGGYTGGHFTALATSYSKFAEATRTSTAGQSAATATSAEGSAPPVAPPAAPSPAPPPPSSPRPQCFYDSQASRLGIGEGQRLEALGYRFRHMGEYLTDYVGFAWRYVLWTIPLVLWTTCLLGALATFAAIVWRWLDLPQVRAYFGVLGLGRLGSALHLGDEVPMAFLPSLAVFLLLVVVVAVRWALPERGRARMKFLVHAMIIAWVASLGISLAVFLGNGETALGASSQLQKIQTQFTWPLLLAMLVSFLPLLGSRHLLQSGREHAPRWKRVVFHLVITGATVSAAFFMVHYMARENISGYATHRDSKLLPDDIKRWPAFLSLVDATPSEGPGPLANIFPAAAGQPTVPLQTAIEKVREREFELRTLAGELQGDTSWERWQNIPLLTTAGTANAISIHFQTEENVAKYLAKWQDLRDLETGFLADYVNPTLLGNDSLRARRLTDGLVELLSQQAAKDAPKEAPKDPSKNGSKETTNSSPPVDPTKIDPATNRLSVPRRKDLEAFLDRKKGEMKEGDALKKMVEGYLLHLTHASTEPNTPLKEQNLTASERAQFNRLLLECLFPEIIRERTMVSTTIVPEHDQAYRWWCLLFWSAGCVFLGLFVDINQLSPFYAYYRDRLSEYFVQTAPQALAACEPAFSPANLDVNWDRLGDLTPWKCGAPYPLLIGSTFLLNKVGTEWPAAQAAAGLPVGSPPADAYKLHSFLFSPLYCGTSVEGYRKTTDYCGGDLSLVEAMAISGAALTPFMVDNLWFSGLMAAFNLRIGQWLPNPRTRTKERSRATPWAIVWEWCKSLDASSYPRTWQMGLMADGGFHDFFGIEELLVRRCRLIVISDAGCNNDRYEFGALADVVRRARERHGIEIVDLDDDQPPDLCGVRRVPGENRQLLHHTCMRIIYPLRPGEATPQQGLLVYAQMSLTGREQLDLQQFRNQHPNFPDEPITNQLFTHGQIESYRQLGFHVGRAVCRDLTPHASGEPWPAWRQIADDLVRGYLQEYYGYVHDAAGRAPQSGAAPPSQRQPSAAEPVAAAREASGANGTGPSQRSTATGRVLAILHEPWFNGRHDQLPDPIFQFERSPFVRQRAIQDVSTLLDENAAAAVFPPSDDLPLETLAAMLLACHQRNAGLVRSRFLPGGRQIALRALDAVFRMLSIPSFSEVSEDTQAVPNPAPLLLALSEAVFDIHGAATVADFVIAVKRSYALVLSDRWKLCGGQQAYRRELIEALLAGDCSQARELCNKCWLLPSRAPMKLAGASA